VSPNTLPDLRAHEYQQRQEAHRLRRLLHEQSDPDAFQDAFDELLKAESKLSSVSAERAIAQRADPHASGQILDNTAHDPAYLGVETTGLETKVHLRMAQLPTSICHLLGPDENPLVTCWVKNAKKIHDDGGIRRLRMTSYIDGWSARAVDTVELKLDKDHSFDQFPTLFRDRLQELTELTRATLNVMLEDLDTGRIELHKTYPIWLLARTTVPFAVQDPMMAEWQDLTRYYGAFVTPHVAAVEEFLSKARQYHPDKQFRGSQEGASVELQVEALYNALKSEVDLGYVNSIISFSPEEGTLNQRVRLPRKSLKLGVANCIDGTVLFASLLEAISLNPAIVSVPGHTFLAWETKVPAQPWRYLETTKIADHDFEQACKFGKIQATGYEALKNQSGDESLFRRWPLRELRSVHRVFPME
jgi:hypothetical protein